ncbi:hypothetical protein ScPMuIL_000081 [Solemya velum]
MNTESLSMGLEGDAGARTGRLSIDDAVRDNKHLTMATFVMKQKSVGSYICPLRGQENPPDDTNVVIHSDLDGNMLFELDIVEGVWGYIRHVLSGKVIQPSGGEVDPYNNVGLVLHSSRHPGALFALDDIHHYIIHKGGRYAHPSGGSHNPGNHSQVVLHEHIHGAMQWLFVSSTNITEEVLVYGKPSIAGEWRIINTVVNPSSRHTLAKKMKVGKAKNNSIRSSMKLKWEIYAPCEFASLIKTSVITAMVEEASFSTWSEQKNVTKEIRVSPGRTLVTWQYVFLVEQCGHKAEFRSNLLANTRSTTADPSTYAGQLHLV